MRWLLGTTGVAGAAACGMIGLPIAIRSIADEKAKHNNFFLSAFSFQWTASPAILATLSNADSQLHVRISNSGLALLGGAPGVLDISATGAASGSLSATGRLNWQLRSAEAVLVTPLEATFTLDVWALSVASLYFPLLKGVMASDRPITANLTISEGASVPVVPRSELQNASMCAELEVKGTVQLKPDSTPGRVVNLFASMGAAIPAENAGVLTAEIAPMKVILSGGILRCNRADMLLLSSLHLSTWGTAELMETHDKQVMIKNGQFFLGFPSTTLSRYLPGLRGTESVLVVPVEIDRSTAPLQVDWNALRTQLLCLSTTAIGNGLQSKLVPPWAKGMLQAGLVSTKNAQDNLNSTDCLPPLKQALPWES